MSRQYTSKQIGIMFEPLKLQLPPRPQLLLRQQGFRPILPSFQVLRLQLWLQYRRQIFALLGRQLALRNKVQYCYFFSKQCLKRFVVPSPSTTVSASAPFSVSTPFSASFPFSASAPFSASFPFSALLPFSVSFTVVSTSFPFSAFSTTSLDIKNTIQQDIHLQFVKIIKIKIQYSHGTNHSFGSLCCKPCVV